MTRNSFEMTIEVADCLGCFEVRPILNDLTGRHECYCKKTKDRLVRDEGDGSLPIPDNCPYLEKNRQ